MCFAIITSFEVAKSPSIQQNGWQAFYKNLLVLEMLTHKLLFF